MPGRPRLGPFGLGVGLAQVDVDAHAATPGHVRQIQQQLGGEGIQGALHASNVATAASMSGMNQGATTRVDPHRNARGCGPIVHT